MTKSCLICKKIFYVKPYLIPRGEGKYCSRNGQVEFNPFNNLLLRYGDVPFIIFHLLLILIVYKLYKYKLVRIAVNIFIWINLLVVINNIILILIDKT